MADADTLRKELTNTYQEIITGSCLLTVIDGIMIRVHFGSTLPDADAPFHRTSSQVLYPGGLKIYARIDDSAFGTKTVISYTGV